MQFQTNKAILTHLIQKFWQKIAQKIPFLNVIQANDIGCHIITATNDILKKLELLGKDLEEFSLETVKMFYQDATSAGYKIESN